MTKLKERIPTEEVLRENISKLTPEITADIRTSVGPLEAEYLLFKKKIRLWSVRIIVILVCLFVGNALVVSIVKTYPNFLFIAGTSVSVLIVPVLILFSLFKAPSVYRFVKEGMLTYRRFNTGVNKVVFEKSLSLLGLTKIVLASKSEDKIFAVNAKMPGEKPMPTFFKSPLISTLTNDSEEATTALSLLSDSELITESHNKNTVGDFVTAAYGDSALSFTELDIRHETGSGKNRSVKNIFTGYLVVYDLDRTLSGKTFISTEGDTSGWGHKSFWSSLKEGGVEETRLEWPEFEKLLHVATTDGAEARYILTTDFMQDLHEWWKKEKGNIRLSFIGKRMYILFPDSQVQLHGTIGQIDEGQIEKYACTVARPLLHVMYLVEDVRL